MSLTDATSGVSRPAKSSVMLACIFLFAIGLGFVLGRSSVNLNGDLVQTGEIRPLVLNAEIDVRYQHAYASPPCLTVEEPIISYEIIQQSAKGFRIRIKNFYANFEMAKFTAKGISASH